MKRLNALIFLYGIASCTAAFAQTAGPGVSTVYYASKSGAKLDCNLSTGLQIGTGGTCTNNDAVLNGILAQASATNPVTLILDGPTITTGLVGPATGYWTIDCLNWSNGIYMAPGSNSHAIRNVAQQNGDAHSNVTPGTPGQSVQIRNCYINGNRGNGTTGNSNSGNPRQAANGNWIYGISIDNMQQVRIQNVWLYNSPSFQLTLNACTDCEIAGFRSDENFGSVDNIDGIHVDGPSAQIRIVDPRFVANDDSIALNAAEGYGGTIRDVSISGSQCVSCLTALRVLADEDGAATNAAVQNVTFTNGSGTIADSSAQSNVFALGYIHSNTAATDIIQSVRISNSTYTTTSSAASFVLVSDNIGELSMNNVTWMSPAGAGPWLALNSSSPTIGSYTCTACTIYRNTAGHAAAYWGLIPSGAAIGRIEMNGAAVVNQPGQTYSALPYGWDVQSGGSVGTFVMTAMDPANNPVLLNGNEWSRIASFYGAGVSTYYRNTTFANLPLAAYPGLQVSIGDSTTQTWGAAAVGGGSGYAQLTSDGTNWTVTGK